MTNSNHKYNRYKKYKTIIRIVIDIAKWEEQVIEIIIIVQNKVFIAIVG